MKIETFDADEIFERLAVAIYEPNEFPEDSKYEFLVKEIEKMCPIKADKYYSSMSDGSKFFGVGAINGIYQDNIEVKEITKEEFDREEF